MRKLIALIGLVLLSGCASNNYVDQLTSAEINKYCPEPSYLKGLAIDGIVDALHKKSCNLKIEENLDEINAARKVMREKLAKEEAERIKQREYEIEELNKIASKFNRSYEGSLTRAISRAMYGDDIVDGLYDIDLNIRISHCQRGSCYGIVQGMRVPFAFHGFGDRIIGSYIGGGHHRASIFNGKINITKVNI